MYSLTNVLSGLHSPDPDPWNGVASTLVRRSDLRDGAREPALVHAVRLWYTVYFSAGNDAPSDHASLKPMHEGTERPRPRPLTWALATRPAGPEMTYRQYGTEYSHPGGDPGSSMCEAPIWVV